VPISLQDNSNQAGPRHEQKDSHLIAADGVVDITFIAFQLWYDNHPVCANKVLGTIFFMAQPPLLWPGGAMQTATFFLSSGLNSSTASSPL
jgi:hypothetical protein